LAFSPIKNHHHYRKLFNNAYEFAGSLSDLLVQSTKHLSQLYPIAQIKEKILRIEGQPDFTVTTNKNTYKSKIIVAIGAANTFQLMG
jgi:hypothetical protein